MELKDVNDVTPPSTAKRSFADRLPTSITPVLRRLSIASLVGQGVLIVSGGVVRLTGSGLGCPTWPKCTAESITNTPAMGIHGVIEFGNRTLTFLLAAIALAMLVMLWNLRKERKDLFWLALGLLASIPAQAVLGGITVLSGLNPYVVSLHFLVSAALVVVSMLLVILVTYFFLGSIRAMIIPGIAVPLSLLGTFAVMGGFFKTSNNYP
ncbi:MAG: COX15/CtaA family protein, partial [Specibacter sp.]